MRTKILFYTLIFLMGMLALPTEGAEWKLYSSFDNNPVKIMDTPQKTYFLVHQQYYKKGLTGYNFPSLALFEYDKKQPEEGIKALVSKLRLSGSGIRLAEYSPAGGYLLVAYDTGAVDLIYPDGSIKRIEVSGSGSLPGTDIINTVTFSPDGANAWLTTDAGFFHIDGEAGRRGSEVFTGKPVSWVGECGDAVIAVVAGTLYEAKREAAVMWENFTPVEGITQVLALMPLTNSEFACLTGTKGGDVQVKIYRQGDNGWSGENIGSDKFSSLGDNFCATQNYEGNIIPNKDGYLIYSADKAWQLHRGESEGKNRMEYVGLSGQTAPIGSWNFENFWGYKDRGKFQAYTVSRSEVGDGEVQWKETGEAIRPDAPAAYICNYMNYSPRFGQLIVNHGRTRYLVGNDVVTPMLLTAHKDNEWKIYSPVYDTPRSIESDAARKKIYENYLKYYPVHDPHGLGIDPLFPERVSMGSMFCGMTIVNLEDIQADPIRFAAPNDYFRSFPGYIEGATQQTWATACDFANPDFDTEGRMWTLNGNLLPKVSSPVKGMLKYMEADTRKTLFEADAESYSSLSTWETIDLPTEFAPWWDVHLICGKHPKNKNRVIVAAGAFPEILMIFEHGGDPADATKHSFRIIRYMKDQNGSTDNVWYISALAENPVTGDIVIAAFDGLYSFDPDSEVKNATIEGRRMHLDGGMPGDIVPSKAFIYSVIFDEAGRMWVGTRHGGAVGVNKDCTEVIARYTPGNSPLPSNCVLGLGWDPSTRSLMLSTDRGLAEVYPDLPDSDPLPDAPVLSMKEVAPGYNGTVEIRNLLPQQSITIRDLKGDIVRMIPNGSATIAEWDFKDNKGESVPSGIYSIHVASYDPLYISVMR